MNYIICSGGLGNQMFQYAYYYACKREKKNVIFDISYYETNDVHSGYELKKCFCIGDGCSKKDYFSFFYRLKQRIALKQKKKSFLDVEMESDGHYIAVTGVGNKVCYGYWQGNYFFEKYSSELKEIFSFENISERTKEVADKLSEEESVAIHIRRGDYIGSDDYINLSKTKYYSKALDFLKEKGISYRYYIFSDDIDWCKKSGLFPDDSIYVDWNTGIRSYEDMYLIQKCKYCILANSSFSWWGGYLGKHECVIRPSKYRKNWTFDKDEILYPKEWIKIEVED